MTISAILTCSTCEHKLRIRYQVGFIFPFPAKIACNQCGKLIKGSVRDGGQAFIFPKDKVSAEYEDTTQTVSISTELPIAVKYTNVDGFAVLTPFMAISYLVPLQNIIAFTGSLHPFMDYHRAKFADFINANDIFQASNWNYFLNHVKKHFLPQLVISDITFEASAPVFNQITDEWYKYIASNHYKTEHTQKLVDNTLKKVSGEKQSLNDLKASLETYINIENEFKKGMNLIIKFLENITSFFPVIVLSHNNDFTKEYRDDAGITTFEFEDLKDLYIEQFEFLSRISSLYFGLLNLADNSDIDNFGVINLPNLGSYYSKDNGVKKDFVKQSPILDGYFLTTLESQIRNGIGHLKTSYDPRTQLIKYYPYKDTAKVDVFKEIYLIDFAGQVYQQALKVKDGIAMLSSFLELTK